jgi:hypothetical protein
MNKSSKGMTGMQAVKSGKQKGTVAKSSSSSDKHSHSLPSLILPDAQGLASAHCLPYQPLQGCLNSSGYFPAVIHEFVCTPASTEGYNPYQGIY